MPAIHKLSAAKVKNAAPGKYSDGGGLWLHKREDGGAQWFLRVTVHGRRREMGLGSTQQVSLKAARAEAEKWRSIAQAGQDPIKVRDRMRREAARADNTLRTVANDAFEARKAELKEEGKAGRWFSPLELHVLPKLGKVPVEELDQQDIRNILSPIWHTKADTARKALNRLSIVMRHAAALGLEVDLQATMKAKALLGAQRHKATNIPAMPWAEVPGFYRSLGDGVTELALRFLILTAARSAPVRYASPDQFELEAGIWTIPADRMKGRHGKTLDFRVPLAPEAIELVKTGLQFSQFGLLFPGQKGALSDMTLTKRMRDLGLSYRPHGFRSSFRTWAEEQAVAPFEVCETALGHIVGNKVERAYQRSDLLDQRRVLMERWAQHVTDGTGQVVRLEA